MALVILEGESSHPLQLLGLVLHLLLQGGEGLPHLQHLLVLQHHLLLDLTLSSDLRTTRSTQLGVKRMF